MLENFGKGDTNLIQHPACRTRIGMRKNDGKLFTTITPDDIGATQTLTQQTRQCP